MANIQRDNELCFRFRFVFSYSKELRKLDSSLFMQLCDDIDRLHQTLISHYNNTEAINAAVKVICQDFMDKDLYNGIVDWIDRDPQTSLYVGLCNMGSILREFDRYATKWGDNDGVLLIQIEQAAAVVENLRNGYEQALRDVFTDIINNADIACETLAHRATANGEHLKIED